MNKILRGIAVLAVLAISGAAHAVPSVTVQGREWLQPVDNFYDYDTISTACNVATGVCTGFLGTTNLTGYTWASLEDVNGLFNYFLGYSFLGPGPDSISYFVEAAPSGMPIETFFTEFVPSLEIPGNIRELEANVRELLVSTVVSRTFIPNQGNLDTFSTIKARSENDPIIGGWFYKEVQEPPVETVPVPPISFLVMLGLAVLGYSRLTRMRTQD